MNDKDRLEAAGYVVVRRKSHEHTLRELDRARNELVWQREQNAHAHAWAERAYDEQRRLADRLNAVCVAAAALGVSIDAINEALGTSRREDVA